MTKHHHNQDKKRPLHVVGDCQLFSTGNEVCTVASLQSNGQFICPRHNHPELSNAMMPTLASLADGGYWQGITVTVSVGADRRLIRVKGRLSTGTWEFMGWSDQKWCKQVSGKTSTSLLRGVPDCIRAMATFLLLAGWALHNQVTETLAHPDYVESAYEALGEDGTRWVPPKLKKFARFQPKHTLVFGRGDHSDHGPQLTITWEDQGLETQHP